MFALPHGILIVESDGNGAALRGWGTVRILVVDSAGHPLGRNPFAWTGELPNLYCGVGDVGYAVSQDGSKTDLPCQAGRWTIRVISGDKVYGTGTVLVDAGSTLELTIRVTSVP